jgi:hypothetical protein
VQVLLTLKTTRERDFFPIFYFGKLGSLSPRRRVLFPQTSSPIRVGVSDGWFMSCWHGSFHSKPLADVRYMLCPSSTFLTVQSLSLVTKPNMFSLSIVSSVVPKTCLNKPYVRRLLFPFH